MNTSSDNISALQQKASDPRLSCWVNASAGSGKTKVLIDRIIRLLLHGAVPEHILCLTFSRAAASEMQQRLLKRISAFAKLSVDELSAQLVELGEKPSGKNISQAIALNTIIQTHPVTIQTVHSFCQNLLQRQLNQDMLQPPPRVMENFEERTYLFQAFQDLLQNSLAIASIEEFLCFHTDSVLFDYLCSTTRLVQTHDLEKFEERLAILFDIATAPKFPRPSEEISTYLSGIFKIAAPDDAVAIDHPFVQLLLTQKGTVRSKIISKNHQQQYPESENILKIYAQELAGYYQQKARFDHLQKSLRFLQLQQLFRSHYQQIKQSHHVWDFYDLIETTLKILQLDVFDQVLLDLDYRIEHILVDEAQDTSVAQWQVIEHLVQGLFDHHNTQRSLFVVGDVKQSIYSFQGADVQMYAQMREKFSAICLPFHEVYLTTNFRSVKNILEVVDKIISKNPVGLGDNLSAHLPWHKHDGSITILPLVKAEKPHTYDWPVFETFEKIQSNEQLLSTQVIDYLANTLDQGLHLKSKNRNATFDDVMILMRKRGRIMHELTVICDQRDITYIALNPRNLMHTLPVQDLLSTVEFMLMPLNDLNLAGLLKSPWMQAIAPINEDDLFELCHNRKGSLWEAVQARYPNHTIGLNQLLQSTPTAYGYFQKAYETLKIQDDNLYAFMEEIFKRFNLLNLDIQELLNHLNQFPPMHHPEINPQTGMQISTVHGAKGLEAPIVVIIDNGDELSLKQDITLYDPIAKFWFLKPSQAIDTILTKALKEHHQTALEDEHNRIFYTSLTRAQEHLIIAGIDHAPHPHSWYWPIKDSLDEKNNHTS